MKSSLRTSFASAVAGGLVVGLLGWVAIAAGWVEAGGDGAVPAAVPTPLTEPAADEGGGSGLSINEIYSKAAPGVAFIRAESSAGQAAPIDPFGGPQPRGGTATGSGFVIDEEGRVVTNAHVVEGAEAVSVTLAEDGDSYDAKVLGTDPSTDIAVIEVDAPAGVLEPLGIADSSQVAVGDPAIAIGNPFGLDRTATAGIVSAVQREINSPNGFVIRDAIQTDAPINPGNSGGPLLDSSGRVIGVNSQIESPAGGNVGIGFAVPANTASEIAEQLIDDGVVEHAYLGVSGTDLTPEIADVLNLDSEAGALVQSVVPDSPAEHAGLEAGDAEVTVDGQPFRAGGDLIVAVDGKAVQDMGDVIGAVDAKQPGDEVELTLLRAGDEREVTVELTERPASARP